MFAPCCKRIIADLPYADLRVLEELGGLFNLPPPFLLTGVGILKSSDEEIRIWFGR